MLRYTNIAGLVILHISGHTAGVTFEETNMLILVPCNCFALRASSWSRKIFFACILNASFMPAVTHTSGCGKVRVGVVWKNTQLKINVIATKSLETEFRKIFSEVPR